MRKVLFGLTSFVVGVAFIACPVQSQPPPEGKEGKAGRGGAKGGPPRFELGQVFPPPLLAQLQLTPEQEKELDTIKLDLKTKLEKLLTAEQKKTIEAFRPRGPGGPGGGPPGDPPGPPPGKGEKKGDRPDRPPVDQ